MDGAGYELPPSAFSVSNPNHARTMLMLTNSYNSPVYSSISTNSHTVYLIDEAFLDGESCRNCTWSKHQPSPIANYRGQVSLEQPEDMWIRASNGSLD